MDTFTVIWVILSVWVRGGLYTTLADLARWDQNFYQPRLGVPGLSELQHTVGVLNSGEKLEYAFGLQLRYYREEVVEVHTGSMMGFKAGFARFPERQLSVLALCNLGEIQPGEMVNQVVYLYLN